MAVPANFRLLLALARDLDEFIKIVLAKLRRGIGTIVCRADRAADAHAIA
jgi:hypothetical protein